ncbi:Acyltransferase ChoActase/COT/CPT [Phytophthora cactorum]|nr:Acyltransferase ChoActase/COT/CPT [Phytophthora cactorum]
MRDVRKRTSTAIFSGTFTPDSALWDAMLQASASTRPALRRAFSSATGYVQDTIIPTYHFQKSLTRLPIPKLEDTLTRYLAAVEPVVTSEQLAETRRAVLDFQNGVGPELHRALVARDAANTHTSYINQWWLEMYLDDRQPLPINYNPQIKLKMDPSQRAASLIASSARVHRTLRDKKLEPDIFHTKPDTSKTKRSSISSVSFYGAAALGAYPLDMSQYKNLFSSTRLPKLGRDELKVTPDSRHVVVQRGTKFYAFDVLTADGGAVPDEQILANVEAILAEPLTKSTPDEPGMGLMTTMNRDAWANAREKTGGHALFVVCLEHESPATPEEVSSTFLVGDGTNHWFDKSFQLIIAANGTASVNFEHAWGDGVAVLRYLNELYGDSVKYPVLKSSNQAKPKELTWAINGETKQLLNEAKKTYDKWTSTLLVACADTPVTRAVGKQYDIGTDGLMQMTIQLAHFKLHQKFVATYESASTAAFKHGRTETVRSCTNEAVNFVRTMTNTSASDNEKVAALRAAVKSTGFDRHLFALRAMAELQGMDVPEFYTLPAHQIMSKIILSTSTLTSPALEGGSFGPVNEDCYGIGYGIEKEGSAFQLSSYRKDLPQLKELLVENLVDLERLLADTTPKK